MTTLSPDLDLDLELLDDAVIGPVMAGDASAAAAEIATFNLVVTHRPSVVVGAACAEDVVAAVRFAVRTGLPVAVQATGHGPVAPADGAVLIATSRMSAVAIDPERRTARVEAGVRWREVIDAAAVHGLAPLSGSSSQVGVVGYTMGGGVGLLARQYGFAADLVTSVELVTADGRLRVVDADSDPELFWAVRGGKGNFGIVTGLEFGLVEMRELFTGSVFFDGGDARQLLHAYGQWAPDLPERTTTSIAVLRLPPHGTLPAPLRGRTVVHLRFAHNGEPDEGARLLATMTDTAPPILQVVGPMPFAATDAVYQDPTDPMPLRQHTVQVQGLSEDAVDLMVQETTATESPFAMVEIRSMGGALARQPAVPNAVAGREGQYVVLMLGVLVPGTEQRLQEATDRLDGILRPWATGTALLNFLGSGTTPEEVRAAWRPDDLTRLLAVKQRVDPDNVFRIGLSLR